MLRDKKFIPVYAEDIHFLVTRAGWLVTHIYEHYIDVSNKPTSTSHSLLSSLNLKRILL